MTLLRLLKTWLLFCRYRLDKLLFSYRRSLKLRLLLFPALFIPTPKASPGERLRCFFEQVGPVFIKFGQLLSTRPDIIPIDIANALSLLQDRVTPFDADEFQRIVEVELGAPVTQLFAQYEATPLASASLAQVHRARLHSGEEVAIKVLRPKIKDTVERDLKLLRLLIRWLNHFLVDAQRLRLSEVIQDYHYIITTECNLRHEAANTQKLRDNFIDNPIHYTPKIYWHYVRDNLLVMEYIDAISITDLATIRQHNIDIEQLAQRGAQIFFIQVFEHNFFHADMHPGNIFVSKQQFNGPQYIAIDCAIVGSLSDKELFQIASLWLAVFERDYRRAAEVMLFSGWVNSDTVIHHLEGVIRGLYEPIHNQLIEGIPFGRLMIDLFEQTRPMGLRLQPSQVLLQKTLINIEGLGKQIYPQLDLFAIARPYLKQWLRDHYSPKGIASMLVKKAPLLIMRLDEWLTSIQGDPKD